jgi:DNA-binding PadR family transcriptional regulator
MRLISRLEEIILLSIWRLQENAYGITILDEVAKATGKAWLTGSIYASLGRLLKRKLVESYEGEPTPERGGRRKVLYKLTPLGQQALIEVRKVNSAIWAEVPAFEIKDE